MAGRDPRRLSGPFRGDMRLVDSAFPIVASGAVGGPGSPAGRHHQSAFPVARRRRRRQYQRASWNSEHGKQHSPTRFRGVSMACR